jgi:peptide/nickel transport system substrate-binding protein
VRLAANYAIDRPTMNQAEALHDKAMIAPIWLNAGLNGVGSRVEESGIGLIAAYAFCAPYEDLKLKGK